MTDTSPETDSDLHWVLLAAGASRRLETPKALAPLPAGTPLDWYLACATDLGWPAPLIVAGAHFEAIREAAPAGCTVLRNPQWQRGRTGSLQCAIRHLQEQGPLCDFLVSPVDCPRIPASLLLRLRQEWRAGGSPSRGWLAPYVSSASGLPRFGHPILIGRESIHEVLTMAPDQPLREARGACGPVWGLGVDHAEILDNLDTSQDFQQLSQRDRERL